jgi:hypothetical protein
MNSIKSVMTLFLCFVAICVSAQDYKARVSKDSVTILSARVEVLKSAVKLNQLKLSEAEQEADIEKQKLKILDLTSTEKESSKEYARLSEALKEGKETDIKKIEKISKKASNNAKDVKNALDRLKKQIDKVEETRTEIQTEEGKLANRSPLIIYKL